MSRITTGASVPEAEAVPAEATVPRTPLPERRAAHLPSGSTGARIGSARTRGYLLLAAPAILFLIVFAAYPIVITIVNSFRDVTVVGLVTGIMPFVGFDNYVEVLTDPQFAHSTWLTVVFTVFSVACQFLLGLGMALLLNGRFRGRRALAGLLMVPWVLPIVVIAATFKWMFQSGNGLVNTVLRAINPDLAVGWLEQATPAMIAIIIANIWFGFPFAMTNLLAALQTIPTAVTEAATVDGANGFQRLTKVTLPMIRGPIAILLTLQLIYTFNVFELILVMTGGGPAGGTSVVTYYAYQLGFEFFDLGPASSVTVLMLIFLSLISALYIRLSTRSESRR
ncbi:sugar ABC transporter permease [Microbacterium limosum]|uniref:Sugar ABC transporter permease n=1 Tax=Microbacterium limosum TaxID=3079935 RepID=A0AAU0MJ22_9MICO|nr:sugar ABC transporter permease [Microbacterium sp. Y20]WOQ70149.1 sugar ABC transporter permease [Microbacterium sp. Y20]